MSNSGQTRIQPVILSGGAGRRLWPVSRAMYPKQFQKFGGPNTLFQDTARRVADSRIMDPLIVCNQEHRFIVAEQLAEVGITPADIVLEPAARNTAPAIATAALWASRHAGDCRLVILPCDHIIGSELDFAGAMIEAAGRVDESSIVVVGVRADWPNPDFGYIRASTDASGGHEPRAVEEFREKPDAKTLETMFEAGSWTWNTGILIAAPGAVLDHLEKENGKLVEQVRAAFENASHDLDFCRLDPERFSGIEAVSFDHAVLEHADDLETLCLEMTWTDASNWQSVWRAGPHDKDGNLALGEVILEDVSNTMVISDEILTAALGVENVAVVVTDDSVLVTDIDRAKDVNLLMDRVGAAGGERDRFHSRVYRPWGSYKGLAVGERFQVKEIVVKPGASLSLQKHFHRAEHWIVVEGTAKVRCGDDEFLLNENESTYIPLGAVHRLENPGKIPIRLIEVQSGSYLGEDDIVRLEDTYGRN